MVFNELALQKQRKWWPALYLIFIFQFGTVSVVFFSSIGSDQVIDLVCVHWVKLDCWILCTGKVLKYNRSQPLFRLKLRKSEHLFGFYKAIKAAMRIYRSLDGENRDVSWDFCNSNCGSPYLDRGISAPWFLPVSKNRINGLTFAVYRNRGFIENLFPWVCIFLDVYTCYFTENKWASFY